MHKHVLPLLTAAVLSVAASPAAAQVCGTTPTVGERTATVQHHTVHARKQAFTLRSAGYGVRSEIGDVTKSYTLRVGYGEDRGFADAKAVDIEASAAWQRPVIAGASLCASAGLHGLVYEGRDAGNLFDKEELRAPLAVAVAYPVDFGDFKLQPFVEAKVEPTRVADFMKAQAGKYSVKKQLKYGAALVRHRYAFEVALRSDRGFDFTPGQEKEQVEVRFSYGF